MSEDEREIPQQNSLTSVVSKDVIEEDAEVLSRPMTAHQKRLNDKHCREVAAFESISKEANDELTKETNGKITIV